MPSALNKTFLFVAAPRSSIGPWRYHSLQYHPPPPPSQACRTTLPVSTHRPKIQYFGDAIFLFLGKLQWHTLYLLLAPGRSLHLPICHCWWFLSHFPVCFCSTAFAPSMVNRSLCEHAPIFYRLRASWEVAFLQVSSLPTIHPARCITKVFQQSCDVGKLAGHTPLPVSYCYTSALCLTSISTKLKQKQKRTVYGEDVSIHTSLSGNILLYQTFFQHIIPSFRFVFFLSFSMSCLFRL